MVWLLAIADSPYPPGALPCGFSLPAASAWSRPSLITDSSPKPSIPPPAPLRALCDYVYLRNLASASLPWLAEHLRLDEDELRKIRPEDITELQSYPSPKVRDFLQSCEVELIR